MKIPRNFDRWMFDYKEGNLSQSEMDYLDSVIEQNPQHSADVEAWDNAYVTSKTTTYPNCRVFIHRRQCTETFKEREEGCKSYRAK